MKTRKIVLISVDVILLIVGIVQIILNTRSTVKNFIFTETPDQILIEKSDGNLSIVTEDGKWVINSEKFEAVESNIDSMIEYAQNIKALDKVASLSNAASVSKYEFDDANAIKVTMKAGEKELRTFTLGKDGSTGIQCYATINGSNDIYLVDGDYRNIFDKTVDQVRSKTVYSVQSVDISSVSVTPVGGETWAVSRSGDAENLVWNISGANITLDSQKAADWLNSFNALTTTKWHGKTDDIGGEPYIAVQIGTTTGVISVETYIVPADPENQGSSNLYYAKCNKSPYWFEIPSYNMSKFQKIPEDLQK